MRLLFLKLCTALLLALLCGCTRTSQEAASTQGGSESFPLPHVPFHVEDTGERMAYLLKHYWENIDFQSHVLRRGDEYMERAFVDFLVIFPYVPARVLPEAVASLVRRAVVTPERTAPLMALAYGYLYHPSSPMFNEEFYRLFVEAMLQVEILCPDDRTRLLGEIELMDRNRVGTRASDFRYEREDGAMASLRALQGERILALFYDRECGECQRTLCRMLASEVVAREESVGRLRVLLVCVSDEGGGRDFPGCTSFPSTWERGSVGGKEEFDEAYVLRALPSFYLFSADQRVLLKDAPFSYIERYLESSKEQTGGHHRLS